MDCSQAIDIIVTSLGLMSVFKVGIGFSVFSGIFKVGLVFGIDISKYRKFKISDIGIGIFPRLHYFKSVRSPYVHAIGPKSPQL